MSDPQAVKVGAPQEAVLGPLLFDIYINELINLKVKGKIISYADDTAAIFQRKTWEEVKKRVETELTIISELLEQLKPSLNVGKTTCTTVSITAANRPQYKSIKTANIPEKIKESKSTKYLGTAR